MKKALTKPILVAGLFLVFIIGGGCRKSTPDSEKPPDPTSQAPRNQDSPEEAKQIVFNPTRAPGNGAKWSSALENSYDAAARVSSKYGDAMPYDKERIVVTAISLIEQTLSLYRTEKQQKPDLQNVATLIEADPRFAGIVFQPRVQALLAPALTAVEGGEAMPKKETVEDVASPAEDPTVGDRPAVSLTHVSPKSVVEGIAALGAKAASGISFGQDSTELAREAKALIDSIEITKANPNEVFKLTTNESVNVRAAKIGVKRLYTDFLSKVVAYKGGLFIGAIQLSGELQIWEFRQPFGIRAILNEYPDAKTRLNTGFEMSADFLLTVETDESFFRLYENGFWGTWVKPPSLESIHLEKSGKWSVERRQIESLRAFSLLTVSELESALEKNDTTTLIGKAEQIHLADGDSQLSNDDLAALIQSYSARADYRNAVECAEALSGRSITASCSEITASCVSELLCREDRAVGLAFYEPNLFSYYASYKKLDFVPDFEAAGAPKRGTAIHPYGNMPMPLLNLLVKNYTNIVELEPHNTDAEFDLALLSVLRASAQTDTIEEVEDLKRGVKYLTAAAVGSKQYPPTSGRNFARIVSQTPCFLPLDYFNDIHEQFDAALQLFGTSAQSFWQKNVKAGDYYQEGY